jgi:molecular chaperone GrpE
MADQQNGTVTPAEIEAPADPDAQETAPSGDPLAVPQQERDELYERLLRTTAEFDNYRKRVERERRDVQERAAAGLLEELLPIVDDLERALQVEAGAEAEAYRKGVEIILKQLQDLLARRGVTPIDALGTTFDPHVHQAVSYEPHAGSAEGEVIEELRRGYRLGDRLLRPSMVKVAQA